MKHHSLSGCIFMQNGSVFHYSIGKTQAQANFMISSQFPCSFFAGILLYCEWHGKLCKWRGKLVTDAQKQSIHPRRRDKTKNSAAAQRIVRSTCPKSMPWNSPGMPESGRMKKTKNRRTARDRIWNRKVQPVFPSPFKIESSVVFRYRKGQRKQNIRINCPASTFPNSVEPMKFPHREKTAVQPTPMKRQKQVHWKMAL